MSCCCSCNRNLVGHRFNPNDEEIVGYYLKNKILGRDSLVQNIPQVADFSALEPDNLTETDSNDRVWYFFCPIKYKFPSNNRINRTAANGFWKITGKDRKIKSSSSDSKEEIGSKKTLVFYAGRFPGTRTPWVMYEYHFAHIDMNSLPGQPPRRDFFLHSIASVCRTCSCERFMRFRQQ